MFQYFKMKKKEIELKRILYTYATALLHEKESLIQFAANLYNALKDVPAEELEKKIIEEIIKTSPEK